ncbi:MAG: phosphopyruvate hydratase [Chloroflexi bacterium]|nr:phosphopyruvate hydratase [Chloroflexota bacterium]MYD49064.1 phosphopyruvate hydratase [Chloroflexota bacterium]
MADATIASIVGREALDSRGNPTVEAEVTLSDGSVGLALVPSGASTGSYEALELRDSDKTRFGGSGTLTAVSNVNHRIAPALAGVSPFDQTDVDRRLNELDGTADKSALGANAVLAVSMAVARVASVSAADGALWRHLSRDASEVSLPVPLLNILNGGRHASNSADVQEFMVAPAGFDRFSDALRAGVEIYQALKSILRSAGHNLNVGDEGGFAPSLPSNRDAIQVVLQAIETAGYRPGQQVYIALDVAASELWNADASRYDLEREGVSLTASELVDLYAEWCREYPIISIEDGLDEDDWDGWTALTQRLGDTVQLVGDDLLVTNLGRLQRGIAESAGNAILLKPNQIGTLSETRAALQMARNAGWTAVMSHRSGETEDTTIADLAVAWNVGQIKTGAPARSERVAKYNRLLRIEAELGPTARYAGMETYRALGR